MSKPEKISFRTGQIATELPQDILRFPSLSSIEKGIILSRRAGQYESWGKNMMENRLWYQSKAMAYDPTLTSLSADYLASFHIFKRLAPALNKIFISQVEQTSAKRRSRIGDTSSWSDYDNRASIDLKNTIGQVLSDSSCADFFRRNSESAQILDIVATELIDAKTGSDRVRIRNRLEELALTASRAGKPVFLFCLSDTYTLFEASPEMPRILEADLRLIFPLLPADRKDLDRILPKAWSKLCGIYKKSGLSLESGEYKDDAVIGLGVGFAGAQLVGLTQGERFSHKDGYHVSVNLLKELDKCLFAYDIFVENGKISEVKRQRVTDLITLLDSFHEMSHQFTGTTTAVDNLYGEVLADISAWAALFGMVAAGEIEISGQEVNLKEIIAILIGENTKYSLTPLELGKLDDSYALSARYILQKLVDHGLVIVTNTFGHYSFELASEDRMATGAVSLVEDMLSDHQKILSQSLDIFGNFVSLERRFRDSGARALAERFNEFALQEVLSVHLAQKLDSERSKLAQYETEASKTADYLFRHTFKLRGDDRFVIVADSASDLAAVTILSQQAQEKLGNPIDVIYYRDLPDDLDNYDALRILLGDEFNILMIDAEKEGIEYLASVFAGSSYTVGINLMDASYNARSRIAGIATQIRMPMGEMPTTDIETLTSPAYRVDDEEAKEEMSQYADKLKEQLKDVQEIRLSNTADGTDFTLEVNPDDVWVDESKFDFTLRGDEQTPVDNVPRGEIYKNILPGRVKGKVVLYQVDPDILVWAEGLGLIAESEVNEMIYDPNDPITIMVQNGFIDAENIIGGKRAQILKKYLLSKREKEDSSTPLYFTEIAVGINPYARVTSRAVVEAEKARGYWHIALGNSPVRQGINFDEIISSNIHLDFILRGGVSVVLLPPVEPI